MAKSIVQSHTVKAPVSQVFKSLTDAAELPKWWPSEAPVSDPRPGGKYTIIFEFPNNPEHNLTRNGEYIEVVEDQKVSMTWDMPQGMTTVVFTLADKGGETEVNLDHSGWGEGAEWGDSYEVHDMGWGGFLSNLKSFLEEGKDIRAAAMGMKTSS
jgi:uncharacterized protein YndB with AHSA1/START domain